MGCGVFFTQLNTINSTLRNLERLGLGPGTQAYDEVYKMRGQMLGRFTNGESLPRTNQWLKLIVGLSPGSLRIWFDIESGWFTEGREEPGARPVYNPITTQEAARLLRDNPDVDLAHELMAKRPDIDN